MKKDLRGRNNNMPELGIAEVIEVRKGHSENKADKRLYCDLILDSGVPRKNVPFYGPSVDLITKKLHGVLFPPVDKQMVGYMFISGHNANPVACFSIPFDWGQGKNLNTFIQAMTTEIDDIEDCALYHKSGSKIIMKKNGDIELIPAVGKGIDIGEGIVEKIIKGETFQSFFNAHVHATAATGPPVGPTVPMSATQLSQNVKVGD